MKRTILLVDDSAAARMKGRALLTSHKNYELVSACDGEEGLEKALAHSPDLILMDVEMPRMTGIEVCRTLRQNVRTKNTPIILLSMRAEAAIMKAGFDSGCSEYILKPLNEAKLLSVLEKYLP
jgi:CheY-like chemotaxis protein